MNQYPYEFLNDKQKVICQVCGKGFIAITPAHLKTHDVTVEEYKLKFPKAPIISPRSKIRIKNNKILITEKEAPCNEIIDDERDIPKHNVNPVIHKEIVFENKQISIDNLKPQDVCDANKDRILIFLKLFFKNIVKDYMIQEFSLNNELSYEVITDFADPILKLNIEFPNSFWHNSMSFNNPLRNIRLEEYGWNIIEIKKASPSLKEVESVLLSNNIYR